MTDYFKRLGFEYDGTGAIKLQNLVNFHHLKSKSPSKSDLLKIYNH